MDGKTREEIRRGKEERPDLRPASVREQKRFLYAAAPTAFSSSDAALHTYANFTHGTLHFCIAMTLAPYPITGIQPVPIYGDKADPVVFQRVKANFDR
ncbi:MAG TPA: hypothetical protein GYA07_15200 [Verrucomicrobia bacterium]|nr:hypothetical protein [Verrucomicrobiota bacterium]HOB33653.1 hypothetical protein [Verrucomicrobiota bacterium]HOP96541.1 hypothetical protein [Verrucomicrobiota bacterium]